MERGKLMISFLEMVGYEYYNGTGFLVLGDKEKVNVDQLLGEKHPKLY